MDTKELGNLGEKLACEYLVKNGYRIIGKNYRINFGEIDIISKKRWKLFGKNDKAIHFIEVKALSIPGSFSPEEHVNREKQIKLRQLAEIWLSKNKFPENTPYQIDIVAVSDGKIDFFEDAIGCK